MNESVPRLKAIDALRKGPFGTLPDYLIIGAQKCGTTTLYDTLVNHPAVYPSYQKEVHYFDRYFKKGLLWYRANMPRRAERHRAKAEGRQFMAGEAAPSYLFHPLVPARVKNVRPQIKLIALLRNPVDRAYSHFQKALDRSDEKLSFEEALDKEEERLASQLDKVMAGDHSFEWWHHSYKARGRYAEQLERWFKLFPREQMLIIRSEDYSADVPGTVNSACRHLGIAENQITEFPTSNVSGYKKPMDPQTRSRLVEYFRPHNELLYNLLGRDMGWDK
jgi:hypothetical protein